MESVQSKVLKSIVKIGRKLFYTYDTTEELIKIQKKASRKVPRFINRKYNVKTMYIDDTPVYYVYPKETKASKGVLYLHGGAYVHTITIVHWMFLDKIMAKSNCYMVVPLYPLAPAYNYKDTFSVLTRLYDMVISDSGVNLTIMGDSAGGGLSLALTQIAHEKGLKLFNNLIMISPWLDITMQNPEIKDILPKDPMLDMSLEKEGLLYAGGENRTNPYLSPIYGEINLPINMAILIGTSDIAYPDCKKLYFKAKEKGVNINYIEKENMMHCYPLMPIPEAEEAINKIVNLI